MKLQSMGQKIWLLEKGFLEMSGNTTQKFRRVNALWNNMTKEDSEMADKCYFLLSVDKVLAVRCNDYI